MYIQYIWTGWFFTVFPWLYLINNSTASVIYCKIHIYSTVHMYMYINIVCLLSVTKVLSDLDWCSPWTVFIRNFAYFIPDWISAKCPTYASKNSNSLFRKYSKILQNLITNWEVHTVFMLSAKLLRTLHKLWQHYSNFIDIKICFANITHFLRKIM